MDKLLALPVSGDAFLLRRKGLHILVDGGCNGKVLSAALSAPEVAVDHVHIVVCTHADMDHAGGLTDLLDVSSIRVDEFWLPGAWSDSLPMLLTHPDEVIDALITELDENFPTASNDNEDDDSFESRVHAEIAEKRRTLWREHRHREGPVKPGQHVSEAGLEWLKGQAVAAELDPANDAEAAKTFGKGRRRVKYRASTRQLHTQWTAFWLDLIDTAERIRKIAVQAIRHNVNVRWFDFSEFVKTRNASGGVPGLLIPLNAVELTVPPPPLTMNYMARLTPVNEECLVFYSPGTDFPYDLGVVFTGDSPLGDGPSYQRSFISWASTDHRCIIATAPHHGSESNMVAYGHLQNVSTVLLWLRSGGSQKHPGTTFRSLPHPARACTHCPHLKLRREMVSIQLSAPFFWPLLRVRAHDCIC